MEFFRRQQREPFGEVEPHLAAEQRQGAGSGPVHLLDALIDNLPHEIEILAHGPTLADRLAASSIERGQWMAPIWTGSL
jgi:hypothetical protein